MCLCSGGEWHRSPQSDQAGNGNVAHSSGQPGQNVSMDMSTPGGGNP